MVVKAATAPALRLSKPQVLFERRYEISQQVVGLRYYDVAPDGQRFILRQGDSQAGSRQLYLVTHWFEELKAKVAPFA